MTKRGGSKMVETSNESAVPSLVSPESSTTVNDTITRILPQRAMTVKQPTWKDAVAGMGAGIMSRTFMAPIERIKLMLQLQNSLDASHRNKSAFEVARNIYSQEGFGAFWRGNLPNILQHAGSATLNFMLMDYYKSIAAKFTSSRQSQFGASLVSGGLAGGTATTVLYPVQFLRTRLALDVGSCGKSRSYPNGMRDVVVKTWASDGIRGMYQGYGIAVAGVILYRALHLGGYDALKREILHRKDAAASSKHNYLTWGERLLVAQTVSIVAGTICYPIDSVRRRLMMQAGLAQSDRQYRSAIHAFQTVWAKEGLRGFYLGIAPNLVRSLGSALLLVAYDGFRVLL
uniref:ADP/ATP translocase n=1 Tax=Grammatophora oceanica TaxID=210454 RepID=A0A7S1UWT6_9STRA|mmetsp:Transcript_23945/g.35383  ORF Transcript_23945/g.35383 Transcript_23945/m.35383 type:complete len:344 (+) Transcript_23945:115-1146(+)